MKIGYKFSLLALVLAVPMSLAAASDTSVSNNDDKTSVVNDNDTADVDLLTQPSTDTDEPNLDQASAEQWRGRGGWGHHGGRGWGRGWGRGGWGGWGGWGGYYGGYYPYYPYYYGYTYPWYY